MADIGIAKEQWLVSPTKEVEALWARAALQEKISKRASFRQQIEDLEKGKILDLRAKIKMLDMEIQRLETEQLHASAVDAEITKPEGGNNNG